MFRHFFSISSQYIEALKAVRSLAFGQGADDARNGAVQRPVPPFAKGPFKDDWQLFYKLGHTSVDLLTGQSQGEYLRHRPTV
jgi:hypothetical protein